MDGGIDLVPARAHLAKLLKHDARDQIGQLATVMAGGQWSHDRQRDAGYMAPPFCPLL